MPNETASAVGHHQSAMGLAGSSSCLPENISQENFDSYLSKLQTICTDTSMHDDSAATTAGTPSGLNPPSGAGKPPMYDSVKSALQNFNALSSRI